MESKKNNKRLIILIIVIICILLILGVQFLIKNNLNSQNNNNNDELKENVLVSECYKYSQSGEIKDYLCDETIINIPEKINETQINSIGRGAFSNKKVTSITIPKTITNVAEAAFEFTQIENILIDSENISIDWTALSSINSDKTVNVYYKNEVNFVKTESECSKNADKVTCFNNYLQKDIIFDLKKLSNIIDKNVSIKPIIKSNIIYGKSVDTIKVNDEVINIKGYKEIIDSISYIPGVIKADRISENGTYDVTFESMFGVSLESTKKITVSLVLDEEKTKEYTLNNINIVGLDSKYQANIEQKEFKVIVKGTERNLSMLNINDIKLYVDLTYLNDGTHTVSINTQINNDLLLGIAKDVKVEVEIIKK